MMKEGGVPTKNDWTSRFVVVVVVVVVDVCKKEGKTCVELP